MENASNISKIIFLRNIFDAHFDCGHSNNFVSSKFPQDIFGRSGRNFDDTKLSKCPQSKCASKIFRKNIIIEIFDTFSTLKFVGARNRQFILTGLICRWDDQSV